MFDPNVPALLLETQKWFGGIVLLPFEKDGHLVSHFQERDLVEEAESYIHPSTTLRPFRRLELYHQQYWWRLLKALQTNFPTVTRLFGYRDFNEQIAVPYMHAHPPHHYALCQIGRTLPEWIRTFYKADDRALILQAAEIDWATEEAFWAPEYSRQDLLALTPAEIIDAPLSLQPYITLFALTQDFFTFRSAFLKEDVNHWNDHPFPTLVTRPCYYVVYRAPSLQVSWKELSSAEYEMLFALKSGLTINAACEKMEEQGGEIFAEAMENIPLWFHAWMSLGWLIYTH